MAIRENAFNPPPKLFDSIHPVSSELDFALPRAFASSDTTSSLWVVLFQIILNILFIKEPYPYRRVI